MSTLIFEKVYPQAPFVGLIRIGIAAGRLYARWRDQRRGGAIPAHAPMGR